MFKSRYSMAVIYKICFSISFVTETIFYLFCKKIAHGNTCASVFFNKAASRQSASLSKQRLYHMRFPVKFAKLLNAPFLKNISGQLLVIRSKFSMHWKEPSGN